MKRLALTVLLILLAAPVGNAQGATCSSVISPPQSIASAFQSAPAGSTVCLRAGTYTQSPALVNNSTTFKKLRSYPGEIATILGRTQVKDGSHHVVISDLILDGSVQELPNPQVNGDDVWILRNEITNRHNGICMSLSSSPEYGRAERPVVRRNYIHDCGDLPQANHHHGIYTSSYDALIEYNLIVRNADRGIQMYSSGQRQVAQFNILCDNGQGGNFSGSGTINSTFRNNVICSSDGHQGTGLAGGWNFYSYQAGGGNLLADNCLFADNPNSRYNVDGGVDHGNFAEAGNVITASRPVDASWHVTDSACAAKAGDPIEVIGSWPTGPPGL